MYWKKQPSPSTTLLYNEKTVHSCNHFVIYWKKQPSPSTTLLYNEKTVHSCNHFVIYWKKQPSPSTTLSGTEKTAQSFNHFVMFWKTNSLVLQPLCYILKKTAWSFNHFVIYWKKQPSRFGPLCHILKKHSTSPSHQQQNVLLTLCILAWPPRRAGVWAALPHWWPENSPAASHQRQELVPGRHRVRLCQRLVRQVHRRQVQGG